MEGAATTGSTSPTRPLSRRCSDRAVFDVDDGNIGIDGHDVSRAIRTPEIDQAAAIVARHPAVRRTLVARQQEYGEAGGVVMEGRDIGTVVFPGADVKIYLDASPDERPAGARPTRRIPRRGLASPKWPWRWRNGTGVTRRGRRRRSAVASDAIVIDTTELSIDAVVDRVLALVRTAQSRSL